MSSLFFELIRVSIGRQTHLSRTSSVDEWWGLYATAEKQALLGICFLGLRHLERQCQQPPLELYYQWLAVAIQK